MMKRNRILALGLSLCLALSPFGAFAETEHTHTHTENWATTAESAPITQADGLPLPQMYTLGEPLFVCLSDGSEPAYWQYEIAEIDYSETFAADKAYDGRRCRTRTQMLAIRC